VESLVQNAAEYRELLIVDQSDDDGSERAVSSLPPAAKLRYVRTETRGLSKARNLAVRMTRGAIIAFTDDDCRTPPDWVVQLKKVFRDDPATDVVFGRVTIPPVQDGVAHGAAFEPHTRYIQHQFPDVRLAWGIGANMSVRRSALDRIGPFDELLGAGAEFRAGEEVDFTIRCLAAGGKITNAAEVVLHHLGVRRGDEASKLMRGYLFATGAVFTKHLRLRTPGSVRLVTDTVVMHSQNGVRNIVRGVRPTGVGQLIAFTQGTLASLRFPLDAAHGVYRSASASGPARRSVRSTDDPG
jgi:glycosyltransferase involved in cell wall biosynthesis